MHQPQQKRHAAGCRWNYFTALFFVIAALSLTPPPVVHLQNQSRETDQGEGAALETATDFTPPVKITLVKSRLGVIEPGMRLPADDDWMRGLTVTVRNDSEKPITHISLRLRFPRPRDQRNAPDFVESLNYGESPIPFEDGRVPYNPAAPVPPGESVELKLSDEDFAAVKTALGEAKYPGGLKKVRISVGLLGFADDTVWMGGKLYRLDKESPGRLIPLQKKPENATPLNGADLRNISYRFGPPARAKTTPATSRRAAGRLWGAASSADEDSEAGRCYTEVLSTQRRECTGNCYAINVSFMGPEGRIAAQEVEMRCKSNINSTDCSSRIKVKDIVPCPTPTPTPPEDECVSGTPIPCPTDETAPDPDGGLTDPDQRCCDYSPVLIDVRGDGFALTGPAEGVLFDFNGDGVRSRFSWTAAGSDDAWLALDRDGDGRVGDASELFGNSTPQSTPPAGERRNGFLALAEFDRREQGGNADGVIDHRDAVFTSLRLWRDANHDGVSQPSELFPLPALDVVRLYLDYKESKREDEHGNRFRYRAKVTDARGARAGRWAWDVYLVLAR